MEPDLVAGITDRIATPPIRVALIGYGYSGRTFHAPLIGAAGGLELRLVSSRNEAQVKADLPGATVSADPQAAATSDAVDLVVIASPNDSHASLARAALAVGKHVVVDKPFTLDLAEARALVALAAERGRLLSVFHNRRWDSDFLSVSQAIRDGEIGTVTHFESRFDRFRPEVRDRWRERGGPGSGLWFDLGPHLVDQALLLFGPPERVWADLFRQRPGALADDWAHAVLEYPSHRVVLHASMLAAGGTARFTVHGTTGSLVKERPDPQEGQLLAGMRPGVPGWGADDDALVVHGSDGARRTMPALPGDQRQYYAGIAAALSGAGAAEVSPLQAVGVMAVVEAANESARRGASVEPALSAGERAAWA